MRAPTRPPRIVELADRLHSLSIHLLRRVRKGDEELGMSAPRLSALSVVVFRGPITVSDLARLEMVTAPTMTRLVQALVADRLVERTTDPTDKRMVVLRATRQGRSLLDAGRRKRIAALTEILGSLDARALLAVAAALDALEPRFER